MGNSNNTTREMTIEEEEEIVKHIHHKKDITHLVQVCWKLRKYFNEDVSIKQISKYATMISPPAGRWLSFHFEDLSVSLVRFAGEKDTNKFRELGLNYWFNIFYYATIAFPPTIFTLLKREPPVDRTKLMAIFSYSQECSAKYKINHFNLEEFICKRIPIAPRISLLHLVSSIPDISLVALKEFIYTHQPNLADVVKSNDKITMDEIGGLNAFDILMICGNESAAEFIKYQQTIYVQ